MKFELVKNAPEWLKRDADSGTFWVRIYRKGMQPERLSRSTGEKVSKERARELGERMIAKWMGSEQDGSPIQMKFAGVAADLLENLRERARGNTLRPRTLDNAELYIGRYLIEEFGKFEIRELKPFHWEAFVRRYRQSNPGKTMYSHWKHMAMVMNYAIENSYRADSWGVKNPDPKKKEGRKLSEAEKTALIQAAKGDLRDQLIVAMSMGLRLRELLHLTWDRVDLVARTVTLRDCDVKTHKGRIMRMSPQAFEMFTRRAGNRSPYVFPSPKDAMKPTNQNKTAWRTAKRKAGIKGKLRYHELRHTFLSDCAKTVKEGDVPLAKVCKYAGVSIKVFESVYLHLDAKDTEAVSEIVGLKLDFEGKKNRVSAAEVKAN